MEIGGGEKEEEEEDERDEVRKSGQAQTLSTLVKFRSLQSSRLPVRKSEHEIETLLNFRTWIN